jgi:nucleotide-binding universal stress UspA family protein
MTEQNPKPIVVAVGQEPIDGGLSFAAGEAARAGCGLHLVHVVHHLLVSGPPNVLITETSVEQIGRQTLDAALERAHDLVEGVPVTSELRVGAVVPTLVDVANDSRMIVLERRDSSSLMRVVTRSVSSGVAARAHVPVVSVPTHWSRTRTRGDLPTVTVGLDVVERAEPVLCAAAAEARSRGAVLHVLHTWTFPSAYDDIILSRTENEEWTARATAEIQTAIEALGDDFAGLPVQIVARHARPADALIEASPETDLLVVGRHDPLVPIGSHLGPIARAVLREVECPVMLVDPRHARGWRPRAAMDTAAQPVSGAVDRKRSNPAVT